MSARAGKASRRFLLTAAVCAAHRAAGQVLLKVSPAVAKYQDTPRGGLSCAGCTFFRRPASCQVVEGTVSPNGWCQLFDMPD
ncbi:MAG: hypothetical protein ABSC06_30365 [Rhodopila sp.]|jgi:hypothetical protein